MQTSTGELHTVGSTVMWMNLDWAAANVDKVNGNTVWNAGNFLPSDYIPKSGASDVGSLVSSIGSKLTWIKDTTPTTSSNAQYKEAPLEVARAATDGGNLTQAAGIGFHNRGTNAALLYYDPASSTFKYNRNTGAIVAFWDNSNLNPNYMNMGTAFEGADPFTSRAAFDGRGGVRTAAGVGPFGNIWYNMVDVRHRNGWSSPSDIWGGELVWGMTGSTNRMSFRSRDAAGNPSSWTEVVTSGSLASTLTGYVTKNSGGLLVSNDSTQFSATNPDSDLCTVRFDNGRCSFFMDDYVAIDYLDVADLEADSVLAHLVTVGFDNVVAANATLGSTSRVFQRVNGASNTTLTLPLPELGKIFIVSGESNDTGAPITEAITPYFASSIRYVNTSGVCTTIGAGTLLQVKGRTIMLIGASSTQWRVVGGLQ